MELGKKCVHGNTGRAICLHISSACYPFPVTTREGNNGTQENLLIAAALLKYFIYTFLYLNEISLNSEK